MHGGKGSQFQDFKCTAHRAELIPSSVLQCVPALGQPGIFYIKTTNVFGLLINHDQHLYAILILFLLNLVA